MEELLLDNCMRLILIDELTANNVSNFNGKIDAIFLRNLEFNEVVLDLSNVKNIESVGVTFVISLYKRFESVNKNFSLSGVSEDILNLFRLMKLDQFFDIKE